MGMDELLKLIAEEKRVTLGYREVKKSLKTLRLVILSKDLSEKEREEIKGQKVLVLEYGGSSYALGKAIGRDHPVKALGLRSLSERIEAELRKVIGNEGR